MAVMTRGLRVAWVALVLAFAVSAWPGVRAGAGFDPWWDGWVQGAAYVVTAAVIGQRALTSTRNRGLWVLVAVAIGLRAAGFVVFLAVVRRLDPQPYPSVADLLWIASALVLFGALWTAIRSRQPSHSAFVVLDSGVAALTAAAVVAGLFLQTLIDSSTAQTPTRVVVTNAVYPLLDVGLVVVVGVGLAATRPPYARSAWLLAGGIAGMATVDTVFLGQALAGSYRPGSWVAVLSLLATCAVALAGLVSEAAPLPARSDREIGMVLPASLMGGCLVLMVASALIDVAPAGVVLAAGGLLVGSGRGILTVLVSRRQTRARLLEALRFQALVEASGEFVAMADSDTGLTYLNPAGRELVGLSPDDDVSKLRIRDLLTPEARLAHETQRLPAVAAGRRWEGESELRDLRGGPPIRVLISSFLMRHPRTGERLGLGTIQRDVRQLRAAEESVQRLTEQREELLERVVQAQEEERVRIAQQVHDDSVQAVAAAELRLHSLRGELERDAPELLPALDRTAETLSAALGRLRHLLFDLDSPIDRTTLCTALEDAAAVIFEDGPSWHVEADRTGDEDLPRPTRVIAYRIAREAMTNARKHARPTRVHVRIRYTPGDLEVTVEDDGRGFAPDIELGRPGHLGLTIMQDRAALAGGRLTIDSRLGEGTRVLLRLPVPRAAV